MTDTGHGMPPEIRGRAFDPFFTTKGVGKGTGLRRVYGFMRQSIGHVTIDGATGANASVRLYLPMVDASATVAEPSVAVGLRGTRRRFAGFWWSRMIETCGNSWS